MSSFVSAQEFQHQQNATNVDQHSHFEPNVSSHPEAGSNTSWYGQQDGQASEQDLVRPGARTSSLTNQAHQHDQPGAQSLIVDVVQRPSKAVGSNADDDDSFSALKNVVRSQSMLDRLSSGSSTLLGNVAADSADALKYTSGSSSSVQGSALPAMSTAASELVRRHHTLSTSSSRLVRLERNKARLALQGVGLSEEDQEFYVPPSPIKTTIGWSDAASGGANGFVAPHLRHSLAAPPHSYTQSTPSLTASTSSLDRSNSNGSSVGRGAGGSTWSGSDSTIGAGGYDSSVTSATTASQIENAPTVKPTPVSTTQSKRSSFVVVRGGKGDAELKGRKQDAAPATAATSTAAAAPSTFASSTPVTQVWDAALDQPLVAGGGGSTSLKHKNSLKPFLEAEAGENGEEEWERSLKDERNKEEMELYSRDKYTTPPLLSSATFTNQQDTSSFSHSRSSTFQQPGSTADPWSLGQDGASVRRHQSLNSFRSNAAPGNNGGSDFVLGSTAADNWDLHSRLSSADELLGPLPSTSSFARSRAGATPAPLSLPLSNHPDHPSLGHSHSLNLGSRTSHATAGLTHSNSLDRGNFDRSALSPVGGFVPSPWSPTVEESKQLSIGGNLGRVNSTSSRSSRLDDDVAKLSEDIAHVQVGDGSTEPRLINKPPKTPPGFEALPNSSNTNASPRAVGRSVSNAAAQSKGRLPPLTTNFDMSTGQQASSLDGNMALLARQGPASASAFVPPIGHSHLPNTNLSYNGLGPGANSYNPSTAADGRPTTAGYVPGQSTTPEWMIRQDGNLDTTSAGSGSTIAASAFPSAVSVNHHANVGSEGWPAGGGLGVGIAIQQQQQIQMLQSQMQQALTAMDMMRAQGVPVPSGFPALGTGLPHQQQGGQMLMGSSTNSSLLPAPQIGGNTGPSEPSIDVSALIASKGYNPPNFDLKPANARFFVIKSYTEEDVHKSLKYEIWASTDLGNKRLDRAFRESADKGPIYLFFSVNGSGHFAGLAQMLTPVDYQTSSNVWASDKWKGVLKVRWIYIKDVPLTALRHIKLSNTPENKPVTSSRDTQEVPYDAGLDVLRILATFQSRTSLLQDYAWYEARQANGVAEEEQGEKRPAHYTRTTASPQTGAHVGPRTASPFASPHQSAALGPRQTHSPVPFHGNGPPPPALPYGSYGGPGNNSFMAPPPPPAHQVVPPNVGASPQQPPPPVMRGPIAPYPQQAPTGRRFF
ncbi:hypothetical protein OIO90_000137 [Microbotryomycetes sp. JL221]|nr:hypothetical protein OIO90_000137 [Microbotryomycetes sp. JL221]